MNSTNRKAGQLLHEEFAWECAQDACEEGTLSGDYLRTQEFIRQHNVKTGHHAGRLTIVKVVETWR